MEANSELEFYVDKEIRFDFWSASHISCKLNGESLDDFFSNEKKSVRGAFTPKTQTLWGSLYKQFSY